MSSVMVRAVAEYQLTGDGPGDEIINARLEQAALENRIAGFNVTACYPGQFGLQLVTFTVDVTVFQYRPYDRTHDDIEGLLCSIVGNSDVDVRWLTVLDPVSTGGNSTKIGA